jgi:uncharacterized membrane-anchored protein
MRHEAMVFAVVLPLLVVGIGIVRAERELAAGRRWVFEVQGYDPRDLLLGHYIAYRLRLDDGAATRSCTDDDPDCCLCLTATGPETPPRIGRDLCDAARATCDGILQTRYVPEMRRYYVPESDAARLEQRLRSAAASGQARLVVSIDPSGRPHVEDLLVNGERIERAR